MSYQVRVDRIEEWFIARKGQELAGKAGGRQSPFDVNARNPIETSWGEPPPGNLLTLRHPDLGHDLADNVCEVTNIQEEVGISVAKLIHRTSRDKDGLNPGTLRCF